MKINSSKYAGEPFKIERKSKYDAWVIYGWTRDPYDHAALKALSAEHGGEFAYRTVKSRKTGDAR